MPNKNINEPKLLLIAKPNYYFSKNFKISGSKSGFIELKFNFFGENGKVICGGAPYLIIKTNILLGPWQLIKDGVCVGSANSSRLLDTYEFQINGLDFLIQVVPFSARCYDIYLDNEIVGTIRPDNWLLRKASITLSTKVSDLALAFIFWIIVLKSYGYRK